MNKIIAALGALVAATVLLPGDALARFGGGGGRTGGFGGGTRARGGVIGHGGFRGTAVRFHPGWGGRIRVGHGFRQFGHFGRFWRGHRHRYGYRPYYPYYYGGAGLLAASYGYYDNPYSYAASPYYGAYPYYSSYHEPFCPLLIRRVVGPNKRVVIRRQYLCP